MHSLYDHDYFANLDGGLGYQDSNMWWDISHALFEVLIADKSAHVDRAAEHRAIDVGCAFGYLVRHLRTRGVEAFGVDLSEYAIANSEPDITPYLHTFDLTHPNGNFFGDGFTIVTSFETMEHIEERFAQEALRHIWNMLAPGGVAVMNICTSESPGWASDATHVNIQRRSWWERLLTTAGAFVKRDDLEAEFRRFWLFHEHPGLFVVQRDNARRPALDDVR